MKQTSEQSFSEVRKELPKPKANWIPNTPEVEELLKEMEKVSPWLRGGSRCLFSDDILHKETK